jgi:LemA protein
MKKSTIIFSIIGVVVLFVVIYCVASYNSLVTADVAVTTQWAKVETQYQRRVDLIPNLVASVKGVMKQEQTIFDAIAEARTRYSGAQTLNDKVAGASALDGAIGRLLVITENYPQLGSNKNASDLMAELAGTENRISVERSRFNDAVQVYNLKVMRFPGSMMARMFGFAERPYFKSADGAQYVPQVNI